jgi:hypothetical protein
MENKTMTFAPIEKIEGGQPIAVYTYFTDEEGWIKRFEPQTDIMGKSGSVTVTSRDPITGRRIRVTKTTRNRRKKSIGAICELKPGEVGGEQISDRLVKSKTVGQAPQKVQGTPIDEKQTTERLVHRNTKPMKAGVPPSSQVINSPASTVSQVRKEATARMSNEMSSGIKVRAIFVGDPDLWAGTLIGVENVGKMLSGLSRVIKSDHYIDHRGYEVELILRREGVGTLGAGGKPQKTQKSKSQTVSKKIRPRCTCTIVNLNPKIDGASKKLEFKRSK